MEIKFSYFKGPINNVEKTKDISIEDYVSDSERLKVRHALEKYCELDTLAEVEIVKALWEIG